MPMFIHPERQKEVADYMTAHFWVADYHPNMNAWVMAKESHAYSAGPFEVMAIAPTLEEAIDKAKSQQKEIAHEDH